MNAENSKASCLHLVLKSNRSALEACLLATRPGDSLLFVDTGVCLLMQLELNFSSQTEAKIFCLAADVNAHGIGSYVEKLGIAVVDDQQWAHLAVRHPHCLSWK